MFKETKFNIIWFLISLIILTYGFEAYIGIVSPGGKTYSPFLDKYLNVPAWLTYFICAGAKLILFILGYDVQQRIPNALNIAGSPGVNIIWACLGFGVMSFWFSFITAHKATWKQKARWVLYGIMVITFINILRIALIALAVHHHWKMFLSVEPHFAFNVATYIALFIMIFWFYRHYKKQEKQIQPSSSDTLLK